MTKNTNNKEQVTIIKQSLKVLSWNIQSPSSADGNKFDDNSFQGIINGHDIACLQEIRREIHLTGYRSICNTRKNEKSGGVGILIRNNLVEGIEIIKNIENSDYLICRLDKDFFNISRDVFLVNSYIRPQNSSASTQADNGKETIKILEDVVNDLKEHGEIMLCGDFNARIGQLTGMIEQESDEFISLPDDYVPDNFSPRFSQDNLTNTYGTHFLNLIKHNQLTILNGRTLGDLSGQFTSIQRNGCSVIDYFAVSSTLRHTINYLKILGFTEFSDHRPLSTELQCNKFVTKKQESLKNNYSPAPCRFIFNDENKEQFVEAQCDESSKNVLNELQNEIKLLVTNDKTVDKHVREKKVKIFNDKFTDHIRNMATKCFKQTKPPPSKIFKPNNPWFNWKTRVAKRELRKATGATSNFPSSDFIRNNFYKVKGCYKKIISTARTKFFEQMNSDIEDGKVLNWQSFKKLKQQKNEKANFDSYDMEKFETFFTNLYSDNHNTVSTDHKSCLLEEADTINDTSNHPNGLNEFITTEEVNSGIKSLKSGKASSMDMISNEILKTLDSDHRSLLTDMFNACFSNGIYPWNSSVISPLHKKGNKSDPDNYRAIAVSSVIGKLFSTILLERLIKFRTNNCPDPPNQLGFTKKAQTYDHILTMKTIASKYKKLRKPIYAVFVDFKKAFDSVCRQALFLKLAKNGVIGNFYNVLRNMYSNSYAYIKLGGHLSNKFDIKKGTEQGHPLSPDLFKIFLSDLSPLLEFSNCPTLSNILISHLLWADDLIMLSLDNKTSQLQLDNLAKFCRTWGIEINELKTKVVIFGKQYIDNNSVNTFFLDSEPLEIVDSYCYLGIILHQTGDVRPAQLNLKIKAMRAFFGLKRVVMRSKLSFKALTTLFDSLIKPIVLYGAPIWAPISAINKSVIKALQSDEEVSQNLLRKISGSLQEKVHLSFLRWALGVHRKSSTIGIWDETGRFPLVYQALRLSLNYFKRLESLTSGSFVSAALMEQKSMDLPWFKNIKSLLKLDEIYSLDHVSAFCATKAKASNPTATNDEHHPILDIKINYKCNHSCPKSHPTLEPLINTRKIKPLKSKKYRVYKIIEKLTEHFKQCWEHKKSTSSKLSFYHSIKTCFNREPYLDLCKGFSRRYSATKLRISAHDLQIERGRYINLTREQRLCSWCKTSMGLSVIEDENHVLYECDLYSKFRSKLINNLTKTQKIEGCESLPPNVQITVSNIKTHLMKILSPNLATDQQPNENSPNFHCSRSLNLKPGTHAFTTFQKRRSYAVNCVCTFFLHCFEERLRMTDSMRKTKNEACLQNNFTVNFVQGP